MRKKPIILLGLFALAAIAAVSTPNSQKIIDKSKQTFDKADRVVRWRLGVPLRGTPNLANLNKRLAEKGVTIGAPIFMRIFKKESELELWVKKGEKFELFEVYPICRWSGKLGPKLKEGDRQAPEGFYTVSRGQLNPNSRWHRSFNLGYPNVFDRSFGRTGSYLMVHGGCGSIGCYAMTNPVITELWRFVTGALNGAQSRFHVHVFPFRMSKWNLAVHKENKWFPFWMDLKQGYDLFEASHMPPRISVCNKRYEAEPAKNGGNGSARIEATCSSIRTSKLSAKQIDTPGLSRGHLLSKFIAARK